MFSVIGPGMFGLGIGLAIERQSGILTLKRAMPMPRPNMPGPMTLNIVKPLRMPSATFGSAAACSPFRTMPKNRYNITGSAMVGMTNAGTRSVRTIS